MRNSIFLALMLYYKISNATLQDILCFITRYLMLYYKISDAILQDILCFITRYLMPYYKISDAVLHMLSVVMILIFTCVLLIY